MIFCTNRGNGCPRLFANGYNMKIHLRSCTNRRKNVFVEPGIADGTNYSRSKKRGYLEAFPNDTWTSSLPRMCYESLPDELGSLQGVSKTLEGPQSINRCFVADIHEDCTAVGDGISEEKKAIILLKLKLGRLGRATSQKDVNEILRVLSLPSFRLGAFLSSCCNYNDCKLEEDSILQQSLHSKGFTKRTLIDPTTDVCCDIYARSPLQVLQNQIAGTSQDTCFFDPAGNGTTFNHPMMGELGQYGVKSISKAIMRSANNGILWHDKITSAEFSFVGLVQIYSDKSRTSLKESAFQFYPIHITLLNFHDDYRRKCIVNGSTFLAFLPVTFYKIENGIKIPTDVDRTQKLRLLHLAIDFALQYVRELGYTGFSCRDKTGLRRRCHPCLVSYCSDLPEAKDLSSVRNGNSSERNCHRCLAESKQFNVFTRIKHRSGTETVDVIQRARKLRKEGNRDEADTLMNKYSLADQIPCLNKMPFLGLHPILDMHCIFSFEPLHGFHLGISKDLKRCLSERLRSESLFTSSLPTSTGVYKVRQFRSVRIIILNGINKMLSHIQETSPSTGLRIDFSSTSKGENGNGLYAKDGKLIGILEGKDYRSVDAVFPFIGMFTDRCCGEHSSALSTNLFVQYVELMQITTSSKESTQWSHAKIDDIERRIKRFKKDALQLYGDHHSSQLCTEKFHLLDHIGEDIRRLGGIRFGDAGLYEYAHTLVKKAYRSGSRRKKSAMDETVTLFLKEMNYTSIQGIYENENSTKPKPSDSDHVPVLSAREDAIQTDCAVLVKSGKVFFLPDLQKCRKLTRKIRKAKEMENNGEVENLEYIMSNLSKVVVDLVQDVTEDGCRVLCNQLLSKFNTAETPHTASKSFAISRVASGFVPGIGTPVGKNFHNKRQKLLVPVSRVRYSQRMVSGRGFYGSEFLRQDCVVVEADDAPSGSNSKTISLWVAKVLALLRVPNAHLQIDEEVGSNEYVFVQYFEVVSCEDEIDKALGCVKLRWARDEEDLHTKGNNPFPDPGKWFDLLPVSSIRSVVHVVRGDYGVEGRGSTRNVDDVPWHEQFYYINRFNMGIEEQRYTSSE